MRINILDESFKQLDTPGLRVAPDGNPYIFKYRNRNIVYFPAYPTSSNLIYRTYNNSNRSVTGSYFLNLKDELWNAEIEFNINNIGMLPPDNHEILDQGQIFSICAIVPYTQQNDGRIIHTTSTLSNDVKFKIFFTIEDAYERKTKYTDGYQRIAIADLKSIISFDYINVIGQHWQSEGICRTPGLSQNRYTGEDITHILPNGLPQEPSGVKGIGSPNIFYTTNHPYLNDGWYMLYNRLTDYRIQNYNPKLLDGYVDVMDGALCIAYSPNLKNWYKYYNGTSRSNINDHFDQPFNQGKDTGLIGNILYPKVHYNTFLQRYILVGNSSLNDQCIIYSSEDLINWVVEFESPISNGHYFTLVDQYTLSTTEIGNKAILTYGRDCRLDIPRFNLTYCLVEFTK